MMKLSYFTVVIMGISYKLLVRFLIPFRNNLLLLYTFNSLLSNSILQSLSYNLSNKISKEVYSCRSTMAYCTLWESKADKDNYPLLIMVISLELGNITEVNLLAMIFNKLALSCMCQ